MRMYVTTKSWSTNNSMELVLSTANIKLVLNTTNIISIVFGVEKQNSLVL